MYVILGESYGDLCLYVVLDCAHFAFSSLLAWILHWRTFKCKLKCYYLNAFFGVYLLC